MSTKLQRIWPTLPRTVVDALRVRATEQPDKMAFTFLRNGEVEDTAVTYRELDAQARRIAAVLQQRNAYGARALLLYQPGIDYIAAYFGCLYAGVVAIPAYPPPAVMRMNALARLTAIVENSQATLVLTTRQIHESMLTELGTLPRLQACTWICSDELPPGAEQEWAPAGIGARDLAFLQYTSGSTGSPKAVMVSHGALVHNLGLILEMFPLHEQSVGVFWLPPYHDMGLIGGILTPVFVGFSTYLMAPLSFVKKPIRWLRAIHRYRGTTGGGPTFGYEFCVRASKPADREGLDLSSWEIAFVGSEPITRSVLEQFAETFAPARFRRSAFFPCYGLAESTLLVSARDEQKDLAFFEADGAALGKNQAVPASGERKHTLVDCGRVMGQDVRIVDPELLVECQPGAIGEIWVRGPSVADGYWRLPDETERTFQAWLNGRREGPFLRTGDLGFMIEGQLYITGRIKEVIILRGRKHYPQDIEQSVATCHPALRSGGCAAFAIEIDQQDRLAVIAEVESKRTMEDPGERHALFDAIRRRISENHEIEVHTIVLVPRHALPRTSSGKLRRRACRDMLATGEFEIIDQQSAFRPGDIAATSPVPAQGVMGERPASASSERANEVIAWLREYAEYRIQSRLMDERRSISPHIVLDLGNHGVLGMQIPEQYDGLGLGYRDTLRVVEQVSAIDLTLAAFIGVNNSLGIRPILHFAPSQLREELLPALARGRQLASFALTEPEAGSNPNAIGTQAVSDGRGGWRVSGSKIWIGTSSWAGVINVFARTIDANGTQCGITGFVARQGQRTLRPGPEALTMGMRGMVQNLLVFDDHALTDGDILGEVGRGLEVAQDAMMFTRLALGATSLGAMKRCAQLMHRYASRRTIATGRLLDNPVSLLRLGDLACGITALESLIVRMGDRLDAGAQLPAEAYCLCKIAGPELLWRSADQLVQMLGGRGYIEANIAPQILRDARVLRILEGPTETMQMFLGSSVSHENDAFFEFLRKELESAPVAERLRSAVREVLAHVQESGGPFEDRVASRRWAHHANGELAVWAALFAAAQLEGSDAGRRAAAWAERRFERARARALEAPGQTMRDATAIAEIVAGYVDAIGDIEQSLPGEDVELDPLLRREPAGTSRSWSMASTTSPRPSAISPRRDTTARETVATATATPVLATATPVPKIATATTAPDAVAPGADTTEHARSIERWLRQWVANYAGIPVSQVQSNEPFATYGLDSISAASVTLDLEEWLGISLDTSLVWSHPNIAAVATHLAREGAQAKPSVPSTPIETPPASQVTTAPALDDLTRQIASLSDDDALELLELLQRM